MIACVDTYYDDQGARTALVLFERWSDDSAKQEFVEEQIGASNEYVPGEFYKRELPHILSIIEPYLGVINTIIIDGYVWLDQQGRKGLGALLYESLDCSINVIGVAKKRFTGAGGVEILRGQSQNPLIVTAVGMDDSDAAEDIKSMHGAFRIPTLLKRVDSLSRQGTLFFF